MFSLSSIKLQFKTSKINLSRVTIIVGPNNSGKSTVLREIEEWFDIYESKNNLEDLNKNELWFDTSVANKISLLEDLEVSISDDHKQYQEFEKDILQCEDGERIKNNHTTLVPLMKYKIFQPGRYDQQHYDLKIIEDKFSNKNIDYFRKHFLNTL